MKTWFFGHDKLVATNVIFPFHSLYQDNFSPPACEIKTYTYWLGIQWDRKWWNSISKIDRLPVGSPSHEWWLSTKVKSSLQSWHNFGSKSTIWTFSIFTLKYFSMFRKYQKMLKYLKIKVPFCNFVSNGLDNKIKVLQNS